MSNIPVSERTVVVPGDPGLQQTLVLQWPSAQPSDYLDYYIDYRNVVAFNDVIAHTVYTPTFGGLLITPIAPIAGYPLVSGCYISTGTPGVNYSVLISTTFASGLVFTCAVNLLVAAPVAPAQPPVSGTLSSVAVLTDGKILATGSPITASAGAGVISLSLAPSGVVAGTYNQVTVDATGRVIAGAVGLESGGSSTVTLSLTGDVSGTVSGNTNLPLVVNTTLALKGTPGNYQKVTTDAQGRVIGGSALLNGDIVSALGFMPLSTSGTAASAISAISALSANMALSANRLSGPQSIVLSGDATGVVVTDFSTPVSLPLTLVSKGSVGTYTKITTDAQGRVIAGGNIQSSDIVNALGFAPLTSNNLASSLGTIASQYPTAGFTGLDPTQGPTADNIYLTQSQTTRKARLSVFLWENSAVAGTTGLYLTQAGVDKAIAAGQTNATLDNGNIFNYALSQSASTGYGYYLPFGVYNHSIQYFFQGGEDIEFEIGAKLVSTWDTMGSQNQFQTNVTGPTGKVSNVRLSNFYLAKKHTVYTDWFTGVFTNDLLNWRTVASGDWTGITNYTGANGWMTSAVNPFLSYSNVRNYDSLPAGITLAQLNASGPLWVKNTVYAAGSTSIKNGSLYSTTNGGKSGTTGPTGTGSNIHDGTITDWAYVGPGAPIYLANNQYAQFYSVVVSAVQITNQTLPSGAVWSGYAITYQAPNATQFVNRKKSPGLIPAVLDTQFATNTPNIVNRPAINPPSDYLLSAPPQFYTGGMMVMHCDNLVMRNCRLEGTAQGRALTLNGNDSYVEGCFIGLPDGNSGAAGIRAVGGNNLTISNCVVRSGDDALQFVPFDTYNAVTGFPPTNNLSGVWKYTGCDAVSLSGRAAIGSFSSPKGTFNQINVNLGNASPYGPASTLTFASGVLAAAGLTTAQLLNSFPEWQQGYAYALNQTISNNGNLYACSQAGTSDPYGNGPAGSAGSTNETDGTCLWNYVGVGSPVYVASVSSAIYAGSYVSGVITNNDGSVTLTLTPPPGKSSPMRGAIKANGNVYFSVGNPLGTSTNSGDGTWTNCYLRSCGTEVVDLDNTTGTGLVEGRFINNVIDNSWCFVTQGSPSATIEIAGGSAAQGGIKVTLKDNRIIQPVQQAMNINGNVIFANIADNFIDSARMPIGANVVIGGVQAGNITGNIIFGSAGNNNLVLGAFNSVNQNSATIYNQSFKLHVTDNYIMGIPDGQYGIDCQNIAGYDITRNTFAQASTLGTGNAQGINTRTTATNGYLMRNDYSEIDGNPYPTFSGATLPTIGQETYNPTPAQTFTLPAIPQGIATTQGAWTPSLSCVNVGDLSLSNVTATGEYRTIGDMVFAAFTLTATATYTTATGVLYIIGLPIPVGSHSVIYAATPGSSNIGVYNGSSTEINLYFVNGTSRLQIDTFKTGSSSPIEVITNNPSGFTYTISGSGWYRM